MAGIDDQVLRELHRAAALEERAGISIVSKDALRVDRVTGSHDKTLQAIDRLSRDRRAVRVRRDLLALSDQTGLVTASLAELVDVIAPRPYVITGGRALAFHDLTDQHFFELVALVASSTAGFGWRGEQVHYLVTEPDRVWGGRPGPSEGPRRPRPIFASVERVLIDVLDHPRFGVSASQAVRALRDALGRDGRLLGRLAGAVERYDSASTARRVGFFVSRLLGPEPAEPFAAFVGRSRTPVALRPKGPDRGPVDPRWLVRVNLDVDSLLEGEGG